MVFRATTDEGPRSCGPGIRGLKTESMLLMGLLAMVAVVGLIQLWSRAGTRSEPMPFPGPGRLIFLGTTTASPLSAGLGLYQLSPGDTALRTLGNAVEIPRLDPSFRQNRYLVSPNQEYALLNGAVLVGLHTGREIHPPSTSSPEVELGFGVAFSPGGEKLAIAGTSGVLVWDISGERWPPSDPRSVELIFEPACAKYLACPGVICYRIGHPFWLDSEQILFSHATEYREERPEFPPRTDRCDRTFGEESSASVVRWPGTVTPLNDFDNILSGEPGLFDSSFYPKGKTLLRDEGFGEWTWYDAGDLGNGIVEGKQLGWLGPNFDELSLSPDGETLLVFPDSLIELRSGRTTRFAWPDPGEMRSCAWGPQGEIIACLTRDSRVEKSDKLLLIPASGDPPDIMSGENNEWLSRMVLTLVAWIPERARQ